MPWLIGHLELRAAVFEYIETLYDRRRRNSSIGDKTPAEVESDYLLALVT
jgi:hypothetical protein